jgi:hypothetical protein
MAPSSSAAPTPSLVGQNYVEIGCKELRSPKYKRYLDQQQTIHVTSGENTVDFDFPPKTN